VIGKAVKRDIFKNQIQKRKPVFVFLEGQAAPDAILKRR
jgi:hypothetical protein